MSLSLDLSCRIIISFLCAAVVLGIPSSSPSRHFKPFFFSSLVFLLCPPKWGRRLFCPRRKSSRTESTEYHRRHLLSSPSFLCFIDLVSRCKRTINNCPLFILSVTVVLLDTTKEDSLDWTRYPFGPQSATPGVSRTVVHVLLPSEPNTRSDPLCCC